MRQVCAGQISNHSRILALALAEWESHVDEWEWHFGLAKPLAAVIGYAPGMRQTDFKSWPNPGRMALALATCRSQVCAGHISNNCRILAVWT